MRKPNVHTLTLLFSLMFGVSSQAETVRASWYGGNSKERLSTHTASGQRFNSSALTAAHRSLPFGTRLQVTNISNHRSTIVTVNDRGPAAWTGRSLDLSKAAAAQIGMLGSGIAKVSIEQVK
jgi:rare lipoprotein A